MHFKFPIPLLYMLIVLLQAFRMTFPEVEWELSEVSIPPEEMVKGNRHSTLRCLEFLRQEITASRGCTKPKGSKEKTSVEDILEGLTVDAYVEALEGWQLVPKRFFD